MIYHIRRGRPFASKHIVRFYCVQRKVATKPTRDNNISLKNCAGRSSSCLLRTTNFFRTFLSRVKLQTGVCCCCWPSAVQGASRNVCFIRERTSAQKAQNRQAHMSVCAPSVLVEGEHFSTNYVITNDIIVTSSQM